MTNDLCVLQLLVGSEYQNIVVQQAQSLAH